MKVLWNKSCVEIGDIINAPGTCALTHLLDYAENCKACNCWNEVVSWKKTTKWKKVMLLKPVGQISWWSFASLLGRWGSALSRWQFVLYCWCAPEQNLQNVCENFNDADMSLSVAHWRRQQKLVLRLLDVLQQRCSLSTSTWLLQLTNLKHIFKLVNHYKN